MNFKEYQEKAKKTLITNDNTPNELLARLALGLAGESGEIAEKFKKYLRGDYDGFSYSFKKDIKKEAGDLLWYLANLLRILELNFDEILEENITKLASRQERGKIKGSGDER